MGLAAAAQLAARSLPFLVLEQGADVGWSVRSWQHVRMFSPWAYNIDSAARELLLAAGWHEPDPERMPTGAELVQEYLEPLAELASIKPHLLLGCKVTSIHRKHFDKMKTAGRERAPFVVNYEREGRTDRIEAATVLDAAGTWLTPNPIGASGVPADGEMRHNDRIAYGIPDILGKDRERYAGRNVAVVGSGHSAIQSLGLLHELKLRVPETTIHWILRKSRVSEVFGGGAQDALPARGALGMQAEQFVRNGNVRVHAPVLIHSIAGDEDSALTLLGTKQGEGYAIDRIDAVIASTGARPEFAFLRELRYSADSSIESVPQLAKLIDPNLHSCGTVRPHGEAELRQPEHSFYIVGSKSYGRAPTFLLATGYEQVRSVVAALAGDEAAARDVRLQLPETGVCSVSGKLPITIRQAKVLASSCCSAGNESASS